MREVTGYSEGAGRPLGREEILSVLEDLADRLPSPGSQHLVVIVGGAALALNGLRETTFDVDSIVRLDQELIDLAAEIAVERRIRKDWLNAAPTAFLPQTFQIDDCTPVFEKGRLRVLAAPFRIIFVMKMLAGRRQDKKDLAAIWPHCHYGSPHEAVQEFWAAYPAAPPDEFLVSWVAEIQRTAGQGHRGG